MNVRTQMAARPVPSFTAHSRLLQRKCACTGLTGSCEECDKKKLQKKSAHGEAQTPTVPAIVHDVLNAPGQPLNSETRAFMEPRFGHDFSHVRIHTDQRANESARAVDALAYTVGSHIAFSKEFHPHRHADRSLLAHELAHVVQQEEASTESKSELEIGRSDDVSEREADECASSVMNYGTNHQLNSVGLRVSRQTPGSTTPAPPTPPALMAEANSIRLRFLRKARDETRQLQIACELGADSLSLTKAMPDQVRPFVAWLNVLPTDSYFCSTVNWMKALIEETMTMTVPPFLFPGPNDAFCQIGGGVPMANFEGTQIRICPRTVDPARTNSTERALVLIHELFHDPRFNMEHPTPETQNPEHCGSLGVLEAMFNPYCVTNVVGQLGGGPRAAF